MTDTNDEANRRSTIEHIGAIASVLTLLGVILYGLIYDALVNFYEDFGLLPNEVGITYADALGRSAAGLMVIAFILLPLLTLLALVFGWFMRLILPAVAAHNGLDMRVVGAYKGFNMRVWARIYALATTLSLCIIWTFRITASAQYVLL